MTRHLSRQLGTEGAQVSCPESGLVDIERCFTCPWFRSVTGTEQRPAIECRPASGRLGNAWSAATALTGHLPG